MGTGFEANSRVVVWGFSSPTLIGIVYANAKGAYDVTLPIPGTLGVGSHTLQSNGTAANGQAVSVSTGLNIVSASSAERAATKKATARVHFPRLSAKVDAASLKVLRDLIAKVGGRNAVSTIVLGYVQGSGSSANDISLSRARAYSVAAAMRKLGLKGAIVTKAKGVLAVPSDQARSALVTVTYRN
jgi:outer membrane protein OmpA-like peptidoglycan-associated protein